MLADPLQLYTKMLLLCLISAVSTLSLSSTSDPYPEPPQQTEFQQTVCTREAAVAQKLSEAATPQLLQFLNSSQTQAILTECCSDLLSAETILNPNALLTVLRGGIDTAELLHNFKSTMAVGGTGHSNTQDVNITIAAEHDYFLNEWELMRMGYLNTTGGIGSPEDSAETGIFHLQEFTGKNFTPSSWDEAVNRLVYVALNYQRVDIGNQMFGDVSVVFSRKYARESILMTPFDSGIYVMKCNKSWPHSSFPISANCSAWSPQLATLDYFDHMFLPALRFWNTTNSTAELSVMVQRMFGKWGSQQQLKLPSMDIIKYWEPNIVGTVKYPDGVSFIIAHFPSVFGTSAGVALRRWCAKWGWPLVWALGTPQVTDSRETPPRFYDQRRIDPIALMEPNVTVTNKTSIISSKDVDAVNTMWNTVMASRTNETSSAQWTSWWNQLPQNLQVEPISAGKCESLEACFAVTLETSDCICH
eukprot:m.12075 g.12075  ORF g.12075 m.12075 type:complete len:474 (-) comp9131_c0_seq2:1-1422(-)